MEFSALPPVCTAPLGMGSMHGCCYGGGAGRKQKTKDIVENMELTPKMRYMIFQPC